MDQIAKLPQPQTSQPQPSQPQALQPQPSQPQPPQTLLGGPAPMVAPQVEPPSRTGPPGRVDVAIDDETYEAGSGNIIVVTLRNPFDVPIHVLALKEPRSTNLRRTPRILRTGAPTPGWLARLFSWSDLFGSAVSATIGFGGITAELSTRSTKRLEINVGEAGTVDIGSVLPEYDTVVVNAAHGAKVVASGPPGEDAAVRVIQPHCETNAFMTIGTRGWLFFKPTRLRLKSELSYRIDGDATEFTQVMPLNFDVRPPLRSVLIGAITGAVLGGAARFVKDIPASAHDVFDMRLQEWVTQGIQLGGSIIMAVIATIALSRKTGAQGFITVEDFFGGFVIGVLVAYEGTSYFENLLTHTSGAPAAAAK